MTAAERLELAALREEMNAAFRAQQEQNTAQFTALLSRIEAVTIEVNAIKTQAAVDNAVKSEREKQKKELGAANAEREVRKRWTVERGIDVLFKLIAAAIVVLTFLNGLQQ